jgi:DNA-binding response OmpR family regulator
MPMRILIIEDEVKQADLIRRVLTEEGYAVDETHSGTEGEMLATEVPYDLIILDIMLPDKDGFDICKSLRQKRIDTRILMLTARTSTIDKVKGLDYGADDYIAKPFDFAELSARIRALLRREVGRSSPVIEIGDLSLNTITRELKRNGTDITLTNKEFCILEYFMDNPNAVITRRMLEDHCWNLTLDSGSNLIEAYIQRLRKKIDSPGENSFIETVRGAGYRFRVK